MCMQETKTLHPQPPLLRELVPQLLSHAVLLIAIKWIFLSVPYCRYYGTRYIPIMGQLRKVDEQVNNCSTNFTHTTTADH